MVCISEQNALEIISVEKEYVEQKSFSRNCYRTSRQKSKKSRQEWKNCLELISVPMFLFKYKNVFMGIRVTG